MVSAGHRLSYTVPSWLVPDKPRILAADNLFTGVCSRVVRLWGDGCWALLEVGVSPYNLRSTPDGAMALTRAPSGNLP